MLEHAFTGPSFTVGIEEELMILDPDTLDLAQEIEPLLASVPPEWEGQVKPELFSAVVCSVPLLDMRRYHQLLAGASWMGEYGDPDVPAEWAYIQTFSPYHLAKADADYPPVLFTTSTRDDRVHPGHARKMTALLMDQSHDVLYYENIEGGHGGAANNQQQAYMSALAYSFLWQKLK